MLYSQRTQELFTVFAFSSGRRGGLAGDEAEYVRLNLKAPPSYELGGQWSGVDGFWCR